jgi:hypothetical protein
MTEAFNNDGSTHSNASFDSWWQIQGEWVEEPNDRRGGFSGVQRIYTDDTLLYAKRQTGHIHRNLLHPFGRPTVLREQEALLGAQKAGVRVPEIVYCAAEKNPQGWRALLITKALDGFQPIDEWYASNDRVQYGETLHERVLEQVAHTLGRLHSARWQHGCIYVKHIFVRISGEGQALTVEVALLDLEKCRRRLTSKQAALHDMLQLRRHSPWDQTDWQTLIGHYHRAMGRPFKALYTATRR